MRAAVRVNGDIEDQYLVTWVGYDDTTWEARWDLVRELIDEFRRDNPDMV